MCKKQTNSRPPPREEDWSSSTFPRPEYVDRTGKIDSLRTHTLVERQGTVIESVAAAHGITWSVCHFGHPKAVIQISLNATHCPEGSLKWIWPAVPKYYNCPWWHVPPQYFELFPEHNPYADADLFTVVRNPYDRVISEYYYATKYLLKEKKETINDFKRFNKFVYKALTEAAEMRRGDIARNVTGNARYFVNSGHWIPQYDFVYEHRRRLVKHVLRFENLREDFHALMKQYDLPMRLPEQTVRPSDTKQLGAYNLTRTCVNLIERLFWDDIREFGFDVMSQTIPDAIFERNEDMWKSEEKKVQSSKKGAG